MKKLNLQRLNLVRSLNLQRFTKQTIIAGAIGLAVVVNLLLAPISLRLDLTKNQAYTLSPASREIMANLEEPVTIRFYVSSELPTQLKVVQTDIEDLLEEYKRNNEGNVTVEVRNPRTDEEALQQVQSAGIPELQFSQLQQDSFNVSTGYFGMTVSQGEDVSVIQDLTATENLEYNITAAIYQLARTQMPTIGISGGGMAVNPLTNQPQPGPDALLQQLVGDQYAIENINLSTQSATITPVPLENGESVATVPAEIDTVVVFAGSQKQYDQQELNGFREYLDRGGSMLIFAAGVAIDQTTITAQPAEHGLYPLLSEYGLDLGKQLLMSADSELINTGGQQGFSVITPYPLWLTTNQFASDSALMSNVNALIFPWASPITISQVEGVQNQALAQTTQRSWIQSELDINPDTVLDQQPGQMQSFPVAAQAQNQNGGELIAIASQEFLQLGAQGYDNIDFVLNILDEFASGGALSGIRQRAVTFYPLPSLPAGQQETVKYLMILVLPGLFILGGASYLVKRR